ncbi:DUF120 domain-containing protein [Candidatus Micrarchaeota archaeon]|nr:DUF120 domain-containing protein [Candidatus Micrarchaeota archaeon]
MDEILLLLLKIGAHRKPAKITTLELGAEIGISQQSASRRLGQLEEEGYVRRTSEGIGITKKAQEIFAAEYAILKAAIEEKFEISGKIITGLGEGRYYMELDGYRSQIKEKLGFAPYPGTLNIEVDEKWKKDQLMGLEPILIKGFSSKDRTYGDIYAYPGKLENERCAVVVPLRSSHGQNVLEIISEFDIRKKLNKKDGDKIVVIF